MCKTSYEAPSGVDLNIRLVDKPAFETPQVDWSTDSGGQKNTIVVRLKRSQGPTSQPTHPTRIKHRRCFDGVAGDPAAGVFNPATPQGVPC